MIKGRSAAPGKEVIYVVDLSRIVVKPVASMNGSSDPSNAKMTK